MILGQIGIRGTCTWSRLVPSYVGDMRVYSEVSEIAKESVVAGGLSLLFASKS